MKDEWQDPEFAARWDRADALRTNPERTTHLELLTTLVAAQHAPGECILDLGIGSGLVEDLLFERLTDASVLGIDHSAAMLALARERHAGRSGRLRLIEADFSALGPARLGGAPPRTVICVQALHEVTHARKQKVFALVRQVIAEDGAFYILDRFRYDARVFAGEYRALWERLCEAREASLDFDTYHARYSAKDDHIADLEQYTAWLAEAGFHATCLYRHFNRALLAARPRR